MDFPPLLLLSCAVGLALPARAEKIVLVAGGAETRDGAPAVLAKLKEPFGLGFDPAGLLLIVEFTGGRLLRVDANGGLVRIAGQATPGDIGDGGPPRLAQFDGPHNLAVLPGGAVLIGDTWNGRVRRVDLAADRVTTVPGFAVSVAESHRAGPYCIALDPAGERLFIADLTRIHEVDLKTGRSKIVAGNGAKGIPADGALATEAPLADPRAVAADRHGNLYILERNGHALRVVGRDGRIRTVVNASGEKGAGGDGGDARLAKLNGPKHLCVDRDDNVIIADAENNLIRKYVPATGKILRVAGTGKAGAAGLGGAPAECELNRPHGVAIHPDGTLYIADSYNDRVLKITGP